MYTAIIIDDEPLSNEALRLKIEKAARNVEIIGTFHSAKDASQEMQELEPNLVFLDIEMPEHDGFWFLEQFSKRQFEVIITTAHDAYAIKAVRFSAIDFLLKPINLPDLSEAIGRFVQKMEEKSLKTSNLNLAKLNAKFDKIPVPSLRGLQFESINEILYLRSEGNYTMIYLKNGEQIVSSKNIGDYETVLLNLHFFRIHHTSIINLEHLREYLKGEGGSVILIDGTELDVAKRKKKEFLDVIGF